MSPLQLLMLSFYWFCLYTADESKWLVMWHKWCFWFPGKPEMIFVRFYFTHPSLQARIHIWCLKYLCSTRKHSPVGGHFFQPEICPAETQNPIPRFKIKDLKCLSLLVWRQTWTWMHVFLPRAVSSHAFLCRSGNMFDYSVLFHTPRGH